MIDDFDIMRTEIKRLHGVCRELEVVNMKNKRELYESLKNKIKFYLDEAKTKKRISSRYSKLIYSQEIYRLDKLLEFCRELED